MRAAFMQRCRTMRFATSSGLRLSEVFVILTRRTLLRAALAAAAASTVTSCAPRAGGRRTGAVKRTMAFERIAYGGDPQQFAELRRPAAGVPAPVVVVVHGGFWLSQYDLGLMVPVAEALTREGFATWNVEYRRLGDPGGGWPGTFLDVGAALDHLRAIAPQQQLDLRRVVTVGHSAGGQLALWLAGRRWIREGELRVSRPLKVHGAVSLAGVVDMRYASELGFDAVGKVMGGSPAEVPARYQAADPAALIPLGVPTLLVHGSADTIVPPAISERYQREAKARGDQATLIQLPGTGHFELIDPTTPAWATVRDGVRSLVT
jgi:acetyl esterase/lipase